MTRGHADLIFNRDHITAQWRPQITLDLSRREPIHAVWWLDSYLEGLIITETSIRGNQREYLQVMDRDRDRQRGRLID